MNNNPNIINKSSDKELVWLKEYHKDKNYGFFCNERYKKIYFTEKSLRYPIKKILATKKGKANENFIFSIHIRENDKGFQADNIEYVDNRLPKDTREIMKEKDQFLDYNYNIMLNKAPVFEDNFILIKDELNNNNKKIGIKLTVEPYFSESFVQSIINRQELTIRSMGILSNIKNQLILSPDWRLIVGLGNESVYETSMTLHYIYGIPYIPGQAIKGVVRSWIITEVFKGNEDDALEDEGFRIIFGGPKKGELKERKGSVFFFDAFPTSVPQIKPDVMNPHYSEYYSGNNKPPADYFNPRPVYFLTVENTKFRFIVGIKEKDNGEITVERTMDEFKGKRPLEIVEDWLCKALKEHGIGAKTAVGYGYMKSEDRKEAE